MLLTRADELEAVLRLSLGDKRSPAELASKLPAARRGLLLARIALAAGDHHAAQEHLQSRALGQLTPRRALMRQVLLAAAAIDRGDPMAASILGGALQTARHGGFLNTVVTAAPQVTSYLIADLAQRGRTRSPSNCSPRPLRCAPNSRSPRGPTACSSNP